MNSNKKIVKTRLCFFVFLLVLLFSANLSAQIKIADEESKKSSDFSLWQQKNAFAPTSVFVVNTDSDTSDQLPGDGFCFDNAGDCSLRAAIQEANASPGANTIEFNISGCAVTIRPTTPLPAITEAVTINGYSQPGSLPNTAATGSNALICIQLDGLLAGSGADGLRINATNTTVRGLSIFRFTDAGIEITANNNIIEGNFIGVNFSSNAFANRIGVHVLANNNLIGGTTLISRNILSGNTRFGLALTEPASGNTVQNNYIGLGAGSTQVANGESGINIFRGTANTIGGTTAGARNVISGNGTQATGGLDGSGILIFGDFLGQAPNNVVLGNYIGTNPAGTAAIPNAHNGIFINGAINATIGGSVAGARNVLSGNTRDGIGITGSGAGNHIIRGNYIGLSAAGTADLGNLSDGVEVSNVSGNTFGGINAGEGNVISGNDVRGVYINGASATGNTFQGNYVGTNAAGTSAIPNGNSGILVTTNSNTVGGTTAGARNYVAGNAFFGIAVVFGNNNLIQGNYVGISPSGATLSNGTGVYIDAANNNTIGGTVAGAGNLISGNSNFGIRVVPLSGPSPTGTIIQGNLIGTNPAGTAAIANNIGLLIQISDSNTVGGTTPEARNIISGNTSSGIDVLNSNNNLVQGNYIGTSLDGTTAVPNGGNGIQIVAAVETTANNNTIGGTVAGAGNLISGNTLSGVRISGNADNNLLQSNTIGLNVAGNALPNGTSGVTISDSTANGNSIGNAVVNGGNVISGNSFNGVLITGGANNNSVSGNRIGTNAAGTHARPNTGNGVHIIDSNQNTIGGSNSAFRNVITGNLAGGVRISGTSTNNSIWANYIGINAAGNNYILNTAGSDVTSNLNYGILIESPTNFIGGNTASLRNVISGQFFPLNPGIRITSGGSGTLVQNNYIGTMADGSGSLFNGQGIECAGNNPTIDTNVISGSRYGVALSNVNGGKIINNIMGLNATQSTVIANGDALVLTNSSNLRIGDNLGNPAPNVIAGSNFTGISIIGNSSTGNMLRQNSIYDNGGLGIDLGGDGVTQNDSGDPDFANNYQNFPVINNVTTTINGNLNSFPSRTYRLEFFSSITADATGYGEGRTFLTSLNVTTDGSGNASFSVANPQPLGSYISATATDLTTNDTSEFSPWKQTLTPTAVKFAGAQAKAFDKGVLVQWQTGMETDNLGFNIYREHNGKRELVTQNLVAGSALLTEAQLLSGQSYSFFDASGGESASYSIEAVDLNGAKETFGAFHAERMRGNAPAQYDSLALNKLGAVENSTVTVERNRARKTKPTAEQINVQNILTEHAGVKLNVNRAGFYRVTAAQLFANGLQSNPNPANLRLFADGIEQPINVTGAEDGVLDQTDAIEFYGVGVNTNETASRVYFLTASTDRGLRIQKNANIGQPSNQQHFRTTVERRDRTIYFSGLLNGDKENFFGAVVSGAGAEQTINISKIALNGENAELEIALQGVTRTAHSVRVELNGNIIASMSFNEMENSATRVSIPSANLREGENTIRFIPNNANDVSLVDFVRVTYSRLFHAENNNLRLSANAGQQLKVEGFSSNTIRVIDVTDANEVTELETTVTKKGSHGDVREASFNATFTPVGAGTREVITITDTLQPAEIAPNSASNLRAANNQADLLILARRDLIDELEPLAALRRQQGFAVQIVDTADIYDEFDFGQKSSEAIKSFLLFAATNWQRKPQFVLFAGDGTYDPKGYIFSTNADVVQTKLVDVEAMETASDDWFADFDNDGVAELAIGRIPSQDEVQTAAIVGKIISYERQKQTKSVTFAGDSTDGFDFAAANQNIAAFLQQQGVRVTDIQRDRDGASAKSNLLSAINSGQRFVSYSGHATAQFWRGDLLNTNDARALSNTNRLTLFVMMSCLNGYFTNPQTESLSEALMRNPQGGAIAVWASSGTTLPDSQNELHREFVQRLYIEPNRTLGEIMNAAKRATTNQSVRRTWTLFGDPTMKLK